MKQVWKFELKLEGLQVVEMPLDAEILSVQPQGEKVCLWAFCDVAAQKAERIIVIVGTGHSAPDGYLVHLESFQMHDGQLVFHAFELTTN